MDMNGLSADRATVRGIALGLGWFSVAIGVAELAAPRRVSRLAGVSPTDRGLALLRVRGAREVATGMALLAQPDRARWLWSRAAADAMDVLVLARALRDPGTDRRRALLAGAAMLGVTALDVWAAQRMPRQHRSSPPLFSDRRSAGGRLVAQHDRRVRISESITLNQALEQVEERWAQASALPGSLAHCRRSSNGDDERAIVEMRHAPGGRGTEVRVEMEYTPRGVLGSVLAKLLGADPTGQVRQDLKQFKQMVETGEVLRTDGVSLKRPAQPAQRVKELHLDAGTGVIG